MVIPKIQDMTWVQSSWQWLHFSFGSGNFLHWQWEVVLPVETLITGSGNALCILFPTSPRIKAMDNIMEQVKRKEKQDNTVLRYQDLKRKPVTKAQARKNMMVYLKNMAGFKMDFFKGMTYNDIRPIFKNHYNSNQAFLERVEEEVIGQKEERNKRKVNDDDDVYTEATPLALKVPIVDYQIQQEHNKPYYKIIRADGTHQLFLSFITLLKNFDREDLEMLWKLVQEKLQSSEPKNFLDDFLLNTFKIMYEKPNVEASIWKDQKGRYGLAKVKS
nr:hypothetical protein [Tanacetum cinerariifolium]